MIATNELCSFMRFKITFQFLITLKHSTPLWTIGVPVDTWLGIHVHSKPKILLLFLRRNHICMRNCWNSLFEIMLDFHTCSIERKKNWHNDKCIEAKTQRIAKYPHILAQSDIQTSRHSFPNIYRHIAISSVNAPFSFINNSQNVDEIAWKMLETFLCKPHI